MECVHHQYRESKITSNNNNATTYYSSSRGKDSMQRKVFSKIFGLKQILDKNVFFNILVSIHIST